ncbi:unnamed protein product [Didymodactylos carnosus]|uniref:Translation initiation factor eIF2B subunit delta n=1 Tax=Didymodactylos carnosus TaxID=1234261 RepID=A0A813UD02_9BILA|nr:unnamed protein product [Didymodactylos carnosus]CAF3614313.1 unnamed protein product [Didymodactylos carnosus]
MSASNTSPDAAMALTKRKKRHRNKKKSSSVNHNNKTTIVSTSPLQEESTNIEPAQPFSSKDLTSDVPQRLVNEEDRSNVIDTINEAMPISITTNEHLPQISTTSACNIETTDANITNINEFKEIDILTEKTNAIENSVLSTENIPLSSISSIFSNINLDLISLNNTSNSSLKPTIPSTSLSSSVQQASKKQNQEQQQKLQRVVAVKSESQTSEAGSLDATESTDRLESVTLAQPSKAQVRAERRAIQDAQRAAKQSKQPAKPDQQSSVGKKVPSDSSNNMMNRNESDNLTTPPATTTSNKDQLTPVLPVINTRSVSEADEATFGQNQEQQQKLQRVVAVKSESQTSEAGSLDATESTDRLESVTLAQPSKAQVRAERRAIQDAQRAAKQSKQPAKPDQQSSVLPVVKNRPVSESDETASGRPKYIRTDSIKPSPQQHPQQLQHQQQQQSQQTKSVNMEERITLFEHLKIFEGNVDLLTLTPESRRIHPAIIKLGLQFATGQIAGSNLRCVSFLVALQQMLEDYEGPPSGVPCPRDLEERLKTCIKFLTKCRPNAVSMGSAIRYIKAHITKLDRNISHQEAKEVLTDVIIRFVREKIYLSGEVIARTYAITKIADKDVILIFGYSSLIMRILEEAVDKKIDFRVIIVDARPQERGLESARRLLSLNVKCTYVLISAVPFIISEVSKVLLGAHGLLGNGYVMSQVGTGQISLIAKTHNVPVLVCCETYKFCERVQTDSFVYNELGNPHNLIKPHPQLWDAVQRCPNLGVLNMTYDVTPPTFISAVITELGILPCTSVAVIIRMQNKELDDLRQEQFGITQFFMPPQFNIDEFTRLSKVGEGEEQRTYGIVYKVCHIPTNQIYALKKIRLEGEDDGVPATAIREISILKELRHQNIVQLRDVILTDARLYLIFEYLAMDLKKYMDCLGTEEMDPNLIKMIDALLFCHCRRIIHRDLKPQNLLVDGKGIIKLADFGLARAFSVPLRIYTHEVVTLWYRAPEVLLGAARYSCPVDVWSIGCIFAEMYTKRPLFHGDSEIDQLFRIFRTLGTPSDEVWPGVVSLPEFKSTFPRWKNNELVTLLKDRMNTDALDLLLKMLVYDPVRRVSAKQSLQHPYFTHFDPKVLALPTIVTIPVVKDE